MAERGEGLGDTRETVVDVGPRAEQLVRKLDTVNSEDELIRALESLKRELLDPEDPSKDTSPPGEHGGDFAVGDDTTNAQLRRAVASALLRRAIVSGSTSAGGANKVQEALHSLLLDGCGVGNSLLAGMEALVASAAANGTTATASAVAPVIAENESFPEAALTIISLVLLKSETRLIALLNDLPMAAQPGRAEGAGTRLGKDSDSEEHSEEQQRASFLGAWCRQVALFSRVIANTCHVKRYPLPRWAVASSSSSGWEPRVVDCALRACISQHLQEASDATADTGTTSGETGACASSTLFRQPIELLYLRGLFHILLSRGAGSNGADSAAIGIQRAYDSYRHGAEIKSSDWRRNSEAMVARAVLHALLNNVPCRRHRKREAEGRSFSSLQLAPLCRALFLLELRDNNGSQQHELENENGSESECKEPWEWTIVRQVLATSRDTLDRFVQQVLLAPSVPLNAATRLARLLQSVKHEDGGTISKTAIDDDHEDDSSEENDSDAETEQCYDSLLRQVHRVAVLWSTAQTNRIQLHQQHALTSFLQESLKLLTDASASTSINDLATPATERRTKTPGDASDAAPELNLLDALTSNDSLVTLMNGVSDRLQSTNPGIRRDGMLIGQALGEYVLHQPVVFDELTTQASEQGVDLKDCNGRPSSSCSVLTSSPNRCLVQRRRVHPQPDPDALYVSESESSSEGSTGNVVDTTGGWSDDSDWDEEQYKHRRYDVDDDEEDLREVQLPLYLQDCLDLLRTSETADGAAASHLAALQALPKLVRDRPADLADFGPLIAKQLVAMENKFHFDDFDTMVLQPLCALVAEEPLVVGCALIEDMFRDGSLYNRTVALTALNEGAWELSGDVRLRKAPGKDETQMLPRQGPRTFGKRSLVSFDSEDATRRWGRSRSEAAPGTIENRFAAIAPTWFYGMLRSFWDRMDDSSLWSGHVGSLFLTAFIQTLSIIVESCGPHQPVSQMLAQDLLTLVWNFRNAEVAEVRTSVLIAVGTSLATLSEDSILRLLLDNGNPSSVADLPHYLQLTSANDCDPRCRALAGNITLTISRHVTSLGL